MPDYIETYAYASYDTKREDENKLKAEGFIRANWKVLFKNNQ